MNATRINLSQISIRASSLRYRHHIMRHLSRIIIVVFQGRKLRIFFSLFCWVFSKLRDERISLPPLSLSLTYSLSRSLSIIYPGGSACIDNTLENGLSTVIRFDEHEYPSSPLLLLLLFLLLLENRENGWIASRQIGHSSALDENVPLDRLPSVLASLATINV